MLLFSLQKTCWELPLYTNFLLLVHFLWKGNAIAVSCIFLFLSVLWSHLNICTHLTHTHLYLRAHLLSPTQYIHTLIAFSVTSVSFFYVGHTHSAWKKGLFWLDLECSDWQDLVSLPPHHPLSCFFSSQNTAELFQMEVLLQAKKVYKFKKGC